MKKLNKVASLFATAALASPCHRRLGADGRQLGQRHGLLEERHERTVLARWHLDARHRPARLRRRACPPPPPAAGARRRPRRRLRPRRRPPRLPPVVVPAPTSEKVTFAADAFFDFDKSVLKPEGKAKLDDLVSKMSGMNLEVIIAVGHTDSVGTDAYNQKLSVRRAEAVKTYLVSKGVEKNRVYTEGKGEKQPVADNKTAEGRAKNRRVEIEVVGTRGQVSTGYQRFADSKTPPRRGFFIWWVRIALPCAR